ncbi:fimbrial protein [Burkholderia sp. BCC0322]|uniref:fimbrial protein n=1 Tax=unclassified Burkholderia TaxID=2613784 RepID=UPI00158B32D7|nr:fimbrial protein [Burkholderia sp. BCC0322]
MKKTLLSAAIIVPPIFSANAQQASIDFSGNVNAQTCTVSVNGASGGTIKLPTVTATALATAGTTTGNTRFTIAVAGCTMPGSGAAPAVKAFFNHGASVSTSGRLLNTASNGAANVTLQIKDEANNVIDIGGKDQGNDNNGVWKTLTGATTAGTASLIYIAEYYAEGKAGVGAFASKVLFTMIYK